MTTYSKTRSRKMGPFKILTNEKVAIVVEQILSMQEFRLSINVIQLKRKVVDCKQGSNQEKKTS
jgi:hypothetical protein